MEADVAASTLSSMIKAFKQFIHEGRLVSPALAAKFMHVFDPWLAQVRVRVGFRF